MPVTSPRYYEGAVRSAQLHCHGVVGPGSTCTHHTLTRAPPQATPSDLLQGLLDGLLLACPLLLSLLDLRAAQGSPAIG